jgi:quinolinate synthase
MIDWVAKHKPARVVLLTECSMSDNIAATTPDTQFIRPCQLCPHMQRITLRNIRAALENTQHIVTIPDDIAAPARRAVERMIAVK